MSATHECPAPGCTERVAYSMLACSLHWFTIPEHLRAQLWRTFRRYGQGSDEHIAAMDACIAWLEDVAALKADPPKNRHGETGEDRLQRKRVADEAHDAAQAAGWKGVH